jgi:predicted dehydrogenase
LATRFALVGAGAIGALHASELGATTDARVTWVVDIDQQRAEAIAAPLSARATSVAGEATAADDVDVVLVATPTPYHREIVEQAASSGKHVFCEKPIALNIEDALAMIAACDRADVRLMIGQVVRHFPEYARTKDVLDEGTLGNIGVVRASRVGASPGGARAWLTDPTAGGGVVIDLMIHELDTLRWYFGDLARLFAWTAGPVDDRPAVQYAQALLRFENGVVAHVEASWAHTGFRSHLEIAGERGILSQDSTDSAPIRFETQGNHGQPARVESRFARPGLPYAIQLRHFLDRLQDGQPFLTDGAAGLRALEAALAVQESARTGRPVQFENGRPRWEEIGA